MSCHTVHRKLQQPRFDWSHFGLATYFIHRRTVSVANLGELSFHDICESVSLGNLSDDCAEQKQQWESELHSFSVPNAKSRQDLQHFQTYRVHLLCSACDLKNLHEHIDQEVKMCWKPPIMRAVQANSHGHTKWPLTRSLKLWKRLGVMKEVGTSRENSRSIWPRAQHFFLLINKIKTLGINCCCASILSKTRKCYRKKKHSGQGSGAHTCLLNLMILHQMSIFRKGTTKREVRWVRRDTKRKIRVKVWRWGSFGAKPH